MFCRKFNLKTENEHGERPSIQGLNVYKSDPELGFEMHWSYTYRTDT
jgi:hypothetical protein